MFTKFIQIGNILPPSFTQLILMFLCLMKRTLVIAAMRPGILVSFQLLSSCKHWEMSPSVTEPWFHSSKISIVISVFLPSYERCDIHKCLYTNKHFLTVNILTHALLHDFGILEPSLLGSHALIMNIWAFEFRNYFSMILKHLENDVINSSIRNLAINWRIRVVQLFLLGE